MAGIPSDEDNDKLTPETLAMIGAVLERALTRDLFAGSFTLETNVVFKGFWLQQAIQYRMADTYRAIASLVAAKLLVPATFMVRSCFEILAILERFQDQTERVLEDDDTVAFNLFLNAATFGSRKADAKVQAVNVLTHLRSMDKKKPGIIALYEDLSEIVHPNYGGVVGAYAQFNHETFTITLKKRNAATNTDGLLTLMKTITVAYGETNDAVMSNLQKINRKYEKRDGPESISLKD